MPLITIKYSKHLYSDELLDELLPKISQIMIDRLSCKEFQLGPEHIDIEFIPRSSTYKGIIDFTFYIVGSDFPDRMARMDEMMSAIAEDLKPLLPPGSRGCGGVFLPHSYGWYWE